MNKVLMHLELAQRAKGNDAKTKDYHLCEWTDDNDKCSRGCHVKGDDYQVRAKAPCPYILYGEPQFRCSCYA